LSSITTASAQRAHKQGGGWGNSAPPNRASSYLCRHGRLHLGPPVTSGILRRDGKTVPLFRERGRCAVRPVTVVARLVPYLRYYLPVPVESDYSPLAMLYSSLYANFRWSPQLTPKGLGI
jgi:hypothetical protein